MRENIFMWLLLGRWGEEYYVFSAFYAFSLFSHSVCSERTLDARRKFFNYESDMCWKKGKGLLARGTKSKHGCMRWRRLFLHFTCNVCVCWLEKYYRQQQEIEQLLSHRTQCNKKAKV